MKGTNIVRNPSLIPLVITDTRACRFYTASQSYAPRDFAQIHILMDLHHRVEPSASIWQRVILARLTHSFSKTRSCLWCVVSSSISRRPTLIRIVVASSHSQRNTDVGAFRLALPPDLGLGERAAQDTLQHTNSHAQRCASSPTLACQPTYRLTTVLVAGLQDEVVPPAHMQELFEIACRHGRSKGVWRDFADGSHSGSPAYISN